jgi:phosphopentomutase
MFERVFLLILDGLGVGAMNPEEPFHTLAHVVEKVPSLSIPHLTSLGLYSLLSSNTTTWSVKPNLALGKCALKHEIPDSYIGHQEMMGSDPRQLSMELFSHQREKLKDSLLSAGCEVKDGPASLLIVDSAVAVGDNMEAPPGMIINVFGSTREMEYGRIVEIARVVRASCRNSRVNAMGSSKVCIEDILRKATTRANGQMGIDAAAMDVFGDGYQVMYLGYGFPLAKQAPWAIAQTGYQVTLVGKIAHLIDCPNAALEMSIDTDVVMERFVDEVKQASSDFVAATVQETDLSGHERNPWRFADTLARVDKYLPRILQALRKRDLLIITADHGNDPVKGVGLHTREYTPLIVFGPEVSGTCLGVRETLADIGATITENFAQASTEIGSSFLNRL